MWKPWFLPRTFLGLVPILLPLSRAHSQETQSPTPNKKPIVVMVEKNKGHLVWTVDSKVAGDPLHALAVLAEQRGHDTPVVVLLSKEVPLDMIWNVEGTAWKAQLDRLRFFLFDRESGMMREVSRGPAVPFSSNPPPN
jgi:biopolymer transport protein ExbD